MFEESGVGGKGNEGGVSRAHFIPYQSINQTLVLYGALWLAWALLVLVPTRYLLLLAGLYEFIFRLLPVQVRG